jgi:hypothetical protein
VEDIEKVFQLFTTTIEVELTDPPRSFSVHQSILRRAGKARMPRQEQGGAFRTRVEQGPCFDRTWDPPNPK